PSVRISISITRISFLHDRRAIGTPTSGDADMKAEDLFHLGIVTDDPRAARDEFSALLGYEWGPQVGGAVDVTLPDGERSVDLQCTYSVTVPRIEIVAAVPDAPLWAAA